MQSSECFSQFYPRLSGAQAFDHYEHVRQRLPKAQLRQEFQLAPDLLSIADEFDAFVFDAYGVLNVGATPIAGACECLAGLRGLNKQVLVLSNGASYDSASSVKKLEGFGYDFSVDEIVSSRIAAERALKKIDGDITWGAVAKPDYSPNEFAQLTIKLNDDKSEYDRVDGFLLLSTLDWNISRQKMLENSLGNNLRPVIVANPDIVSPREDHFGMEPGYIGHRLIEKFGAKVDFYGKPFQSVFDIIDERLTDNIAPERICMIGDTLHTDILGGGAKGWKTVLVSDHGMFKSLDVVTFIERSGIVPDWVIPGI